MLSGLFLVFLGTATRLHRLVLMKDHVRSGLVWLLPFASGTSISFMIGHLIFCADIASITD